MTDTRTRPLPVTQDLSSGTHDPIEFFRSRGSRWHKRAIYSVIRPWLDRQARRELTGSLIAKTHPRLVMPERGLPFETRRQWLHQRAGLTGKTILVQGAGNGWEVLSYLPFRPQRIIAVDLYPFDASWERVRREAERQGVDVEFAVSPNEAITLPARSVDVCVSDAVFEHCRDFDAVIAESRRVLKPAGYLYAFYGPLWYCHGGDHLSDRAGLEHGYRHLELSYSQLLEWSHEVPRASEDAQAGRRYVELDLFSKLTTLEYLAAYKRHGFAICDLILEVSGAAAEFRRRDPDAFAALLRRLPLLDPDDLLIKGNLVVLRKLGDE